MKNLIEDIYDNYYFEKTTKNSEKIKKELHIVVEKQNKLNSVIGEKERALLEEYDEARSTLELASHKESFVNGVIFGAKFILEILDTK
ncbi:MAG: hypothetical protein E7613_02080 [Ruminococcaceae bacterium]|nr:hypothetical protein [Oscillospiraceae bacterium]